MKKIVNGIEVDMTQEEIDALNSSRAELRAEMDSYIVKRQQAYPPLTEQLDMLYKDMLNGTTIWQDTISSIKNTYPKA